MKTPRRPKTHFVPAVVFRTAFAGVVPICVVGIACGGSGGGTGGSDAGDATFNGAVGCAGFACMGVGVQAFADGGDAQLLSVACIGFDGQPCGVEPVDAGLEGSRAVDANGDVQALGVACLGFCGVGVSAFGDGGDSG